MKTAGNQIAQLSADQGSALERMLSADQAVPGEMLRILSIDDQAQTQVGDALGGLGQLGQRGQGQPVIKDFAFGRTWSPGRQGRQTEQAVALQTFDANGG